MPVPVLLGIPWLAGVIASAFLGIFTWFMSYMTKRLAFVAAAIIVIVSLTTALFAGIHSLTAGLVYVLPAAITQSVGLFAPSNLSLCISVLVSAKMLRYAYEWNIKIIQLKLV